jgi:hypothetical protein
MTRYLGLIIVSTLSFMGAAHAQTIVKQEPPGGGLQRGEVLWVDNGQCPKGQIMQVTAGTSGGRSGGTQGVQVGRTRTCVTRR